jgi:hypothetical protein
LKECCHFYEALRHKWLKIDLYNSPQSLRALAPIVLRSTQEGTHAQSDVHVCCTLGCFGSSCIVAQLIVQVLDNDANLFDREWESALA